MSRKTDKAYRESLGCKLAKSPTVDHPRLLDDLFRSIKSLIELQKKMRSSFGVLLFVSASLPRSLKVRVWKQCLFSPDTEQYCMHEKQPLCERKVFSLPPQFDPVFIERPNLDADVRVCKSHILTCNDPEAFPDISAIACQVELCCPKQCLFFQSTRLC